MSFNFSTRKTLLLLFSLLSIWTNPLLADKSKHILIVANSNDTPYQEAILGFKKQMGDQSGIKFTEMSLAQTQPIDSIKPDVVFALGTEAINWASSQTSRIPIVATMVLKDDVLRHSANVTGVILGYPLRTQLQWLKKFFPQQKAVAVLFNPAENAATIQEARQISQQNGLKLVAIPVESLKELPYALEQLANNVDVLFGIQDETVMSVNTAKEVLLASFTYKIPLVGLSDNWVKSGAFYALSWDYPDIGKQCAQQAQKLLAGNPISSIPPEHPQKVTYTINAKIAAHMDIEIPDELRKNAKMVYD